MPTQWTCAQCYNQNPLEMRFCPHCGAINPALSAQAAAPPGGDSNSLWLQNRKLLWGVAIGLWVLGCIVFGGVGYIFWNHSQSSEGAAVVPKATASAEASEAPTAPTGEPTATSTDTPVSEPTATPISEPINEAADSLAGDNNAAGESSTSAGDTLTMPTAASAPEGVILFLSSRDHDPQEPPGPTGPGQNRQLELYAMRPDGNQQTRLSVGSQEFWNGDAAITPYHIPNQLVINGKYVFDLITGQVVDEVELEFPNTNLDIPFRGYSPVWSSDGDIYFYGNKSDGRSGIYYLDNLQGEPQKLTSPPSDVWGDGFPSLSPDGEWIAFYRNWYDEAQNGVWVMRSDGNEAHRIIAAEQEGIVARRAFWSPDGSKLAFEGEKSNVTFSFEVWIAEADGSNPQQLTSLPEDIGAWEPKWSPDGQRIVFHGGDGSLGHIYVVDTAGGEPQQLTEVGDANLAPLWLPLSLDDIFIPSPDDFAPTPTPEPVAVAPKPAAPANCPNPGVQITSPPEGTVFQQRRVFIIGNANIHNFHHWRIEYSTVKDGHTWNYLLERDYPVENDKLIMLDTSTVPRGPYGLRLTVVDVTGNYPEPCEVWFTNGY